MFNLEQTSNDVKLHVILQINKLIFNVEPKPGQSDGSGSSQIPRLRNPDFILHLYVWIRIRIGDPDLQSLKFFLTVQSDKFL